MRLIATHEDVPYLALADAAQACFDRREDLQRYAPDEGFHSWHCDWNNAGSLDAYVVRLASAPMGASIRSGWPPPSKRWASGPW